MKRNLLAATLAFALLSLGTQATFAHNHGGEKKAKKEMKKKHTCSSTCTAEMHSYKHGEKGHKCTAECHKK